MDPNRFDALLRSLAAPSARRRAASALAALGLAPWLGPAETDAKPKKRKKKKKKRPIPCVPDCAGKECGGNGCGGTCGTCGTGQVCDTQSAQCVLDPGICSPACATGYTCVNNTCVCPNGVCPCPPGTPDVCGFGGNRICVNFQNDKNHCGGCQPCCGPPGDPVCAGWECCSGSCTYLPGCTTNSNLSDCRGKPCGACNSPCPDSVPFCCNGVCVAMDENNCGYCGAKCPAGTKCCGPGNCQQTC